MTPEAMAAIMARAYRHQTPWRACDIASLAARTTTRVVESEAGFLLAQVVADEAEILALAIDPAEQRQGRARALLARFHALAAAESVVRTVLDVAVDNLPARRLYEGAGYIETARRAGYYPRADGSRADALLMARALTEGHPPL